MFVLSKLSEMCLIDSVIGKFRWGKLLNIDFIPAKKREEKVIKARNWVIIFLG